jgi:uncharacterized membrane protein YozB (DUF420 family)
LNKRRVKQDGPNSFFLPSLTALFFKTSSQFSLSVTVLIQKRQITTAHKKLMKCAQITVVTYYFKFSPAPASI